MKMDSNCSLKLNQLLWIISIGLLAVGLCGMTDYSERAAIAHRAMDVASTSATVQSFSQSGQHATKPIEADTKIAGVSWLPTSLGLFLALICLAMRVGWLIDGRIRRHALLNAELSDANHD
jgi:hypothetical protein